MIITVPYSADEGFDPKNIPQTKQDLLAYEKEGSPALIPKNETGYYQLNIPKWKKSKKIYEITHLTEYSFFEPYYLTQRNIQLYDETFISWGNDKVTQIYDMRSAGYKLNVFPDTFMVHLSHNDLKNYKGWNTHFNSGPRHRIKVKTSIKRREVMPGLLTNTYYPQWLKKTTLCVRVEEEKIKKLENLYELIVFTRYTIENSKHMLCLTIIILISSIIFLIMTSCNKNKSKKGLLK